MKRNITSLQSSKRTTERKLSSQNSIDKCECIFITQKRKTDCERKRENRNFKIEFIKEKERVCPCKRTDLETRRKNSNKFVNIKPLRKFIWE